MHLSNFKFWTLSLIFIWTRSQSFSQEPDLHYSKCVDEHGIPQKCTPEFVNAAYNKRVEATNTCGEQGPSEYCIQSGSLGLRRACDICDARSPRHSHSADFLTDFNNNENETWWQSETMYEGVQWPLQMNLTLNLGKSFEITYIRLKFHSPRPESFAIFKRTSEDGPWLPLQFYSTSCRDTYALPDLTYIHGGDETRPLCTSESSDISPLSGASIAFSTLEGRPSAYDFDNRKDLQEWVTASDIRITLDRLNTFGDEVFGDEKVLRSYFYAITDFAIGGRCKCNGHASECVWSSNEDRREHRLVCRCEHNTAGPDCNECLPFYNDVPWGRATTDNVQECKACNCNGFSDRCFFDQKLYDSTGHGGHCMECRFNRDGANCERCKVNFYQSQRLEGHCIPCYCNEVGSRNLQCNIEGKCQCKPGVTGEKCDRCLPNYYDFGPQGCKPCSCSEAGSFGNEPNCDTITGTCRCKENVEGQMCDKCRPNYFNLDLENDFGCTPCFCFGHSAVCRSAPGYGQVVLESTFSRSNDRWMGEEAYGGPIPVQYNAVTQNIEIKSSGREAVYFVAPDRFLGDQRGSYNQEISFNLRIGEHGPKPSAEDVIIEGAGLRISRPIFGKPANTLPSIQEQEFSFRLHEHPDFGWNPRLTSRDFMSILVNLTSIKIRGTYTQKGVGFLDNVKFKTARRGSSAGSLATWVEMCTCPEGYIGQYCESCAPGFTHEPKNGGPFARCVPCTCNGHADNCAPESGQCICEHNTAGDNCERCEKGWYGNSLKGTKDDCSPCPCPNQGACIQLQDEQIICVDCPVGYAGKVCQFCADGYFGDPEGLMGPPSKCVPCECNENVDNNAVGNCNRTTGECLKCIYNTFGPKCDQCLPGYFGDPLAMPKGDCKFCECDTFGTISTADNKFICEQPTGQCPCKDNVIGRQCNYCDEGYFNLQSGNGCSECNCDPIGSINGSCSQNSWTLGQCNCRQGILGIRCTDCAPNHYGFSVNGCVPCECDQIGSLSLQCDPFGLCPCRENVEGRACDRCKENKYNRQAGCVDCPACFNLILEAVNSQRAKLDEMEKILDEIKNTPTVIDDQDFEKKLAQVQKRVDKLYKDAKSATGGDDVSLLDKVKELKEKAMHLDKTHKEIRNSLGQCKISAGESFTNLTKAEGSVERAQESLKIAQRFLDSDGKEALEKAQEKSLEYGRQSTLLSELARQARLLADDHEQKVEEIEKIANTALNSSTVAFDLTRNSINQQRDSSEESRRLQSEILQLEDEMRQTEAKAKDANRRAKEAYNSALNQFTNANVQGLPTLDLQAIKEQALKARAEAAKLKETVSALMEGREQLLKEANEEAKQAKEMLSQAYKHQQMADELLADLDSAKASAEDAKNQSENTFNEAQKIYDTLHDFHRGVEESKIKAAESKTQIPKIEELIYSALNQTNENQRALYGAKDSAKAALSDAEKAKEIAEGASKEADTIRSECRETKEKAAELRDEASTLSSRVADTFATLTKAERKLEEEDTLIISALDKASEAKSTVDTAYEKIGRALESVRDIAIALDNLDHINENGLENLEKKISDVEAEFESAGLDEKIEKLVQARNKQTLWLKNYEEELEMLKREVENVIEIKNALPPIDRCFKRLRLEP